MDSLRRVIARRFDGARERGFSLIELVVAMGIFTIFIAMFVGAVATLSQGTAKAQVTAEASSGALIVFQSIDRQVRYAESINRPGVGASGARYIEFRTLASSSWNGKNNCTQWRYDPSTKRIESREWEDIPGNSPGNFLTKLVNVVERPGVGYPFSMIPATVDGSAKQRLALTLIAGNEDIDAATEIDTSFVAKNSSITSQSNSDADGDGASDNNVCLGTGDRP